MWGLQHMVLDRVLEHLQPSHVLVLHARGMRNTTGVGYFQLLFHLKGVVPPNQRIYVHCFEGGRELMVKWLSEFPNTFFGFTGLVQHFDAASKEALRCIQEEKLLIETDSPYFRIGGRQLLTSTTGDGSQHGGWSSGQVVNIGVGGRFAQCESPLRRVNRDPESLPSQHWGGGKCEFSRCSPFPNIWGDGQEVWVQSFPKFQQVDRLEEPTYSS